MQGRSLRHVVLSASVLAVTFLRSYGLPRYAMNFFIAYTASRYIAATSARNSSFHSMPCCMRAATSIVGKKRAPAARSGRTDKEENIFTTTRSVWCGVWSVLR
jgi:hypothetical protein